MWYHQYEQQFGDEIRKKKWSTKRIIKKTGLDLTQSKALAAFCRKGVQPPTDLAGPIVNVEPVEEQEDFQFFMSEDYIYNGDNDTYVTIIRNAPRPICLSGDIHRAIIRAYSNYDGQPATINEIARTFKIPKNYIPQYLKIHGMTHDREPFTPEEITTRSDEDLIEDALQQRRSVLHRKMEAAKWKETAKDAAKWRKFESSLLIAFEGGLNRRTPKRKKRKVLPKNSGETVGVLGLSDLHWGKYSEAGENGENYNRVIAKERLFRSTEEVLSRLKLQETPQKLYVPVGSDFLHIDTDLNTTTRGTPQDSDGTPAEIFMSACNVLEEWVDLVSEKIPVELVLMSGNHDRMLGVALLVFLEALYRKDGRVTTCLHRTPRVYREFGSNLLGFTHGDGVSKVKNLAGLMAQENRQAWGRCEHKTFYTGHLHHEKTETDTLFQVTKRQLPALSGPDRWHARKGYVGAPKSLPLYIHDKDKGLVTILYGK